MLSTDANLSHGRGGRFFGPGGKKIHTLIINAVVLAAFVFSLFPAASSSACLRAPVPEKIDGVMIGERIVSTAFRLGVVPEAMVGRLSLWEGSDKVSGVTGFLGCPRGFSSKKQKEVIGRIKNKGISIAYVEDPPVPCLYVPGLSYKNSCELLEKQGVAIEKIDFTNGLFPAVRQIAKKFGKQEQAESVIAGYQKSLSRAQKEMAKVRPGIRVAILSGIYQKKTGKTFVRMETKGGYTDQFILDKCGAVNIAPEIMRQSDKPSKGHVMIQKLERVLEANPDLIAITGDAFAVIHGLNKALMKNTKLKQTAAVSSCAILPLPFYSEADPLGYPEVLMKWAGGLQCIK